VWKSRSVRGEGVPGFRKELQIQKNNRVALNKTTEPLDAFGNFMRRKRSEPNSAITNKLNHASSGEFIRLNHDRPELKKSQKRREEFIKIWK